MRISVSNIAWDTVEDESIAKLLLKFAIDAIDIAPSKYFYDILSVKDNDIKHVKKFWENQGIEIVGMQSLLFGMNDLNIFGTHDIQKKMLNYLKSICRIGEGVGAKHLVFGSPKNRLKGNIPSAESLAIACDFFYKLGDIAKSYGIIICLEPNPLCYGADFMVNSFEAIDIVSTVQHNFIKMQLDLGTVTINQEKIENILLHQDKIGHIHISEPNLITIGDSETNHKLYAEALTQAKIDAIFCIEMLASKTECHLEAIDRALKYVQSIYQSRY